LLLARLDVAAGDCLFVDDQPGNIAGAQALGFATVLFDPTDAGTSVSLVRAALALG
jgi:FMN phosphatase YigB (HAD superfamily)